MQVDNEINSLILRIKLSEYVKDIKVEDNEEERKYEVEIKDKNNKTRVLIKLEYMIYCNRLFSIKEIAGIEDGLKLVDINKKTYIIKVR